MNPGAPLLSTPLPELHTRKSSLGSLLGEAQTDVFYVKEDNKVQSISDSGSFGNPIGILLLLGHASSTLLILRAISNFSWYAPHVKGNALFCGVANGAST